MTVPLFKSQPLQFLDCISQLHFLCVASVQLTMSSLIVFPTW